MHIKKFKFSNLIIKIGTDSKELMELIKKDSLTYIEELLTFQEPIVEFTIIKANNNLKVPQHAKKLILHPRDETLYGDEWYTGNKRFIYNPHYRALYEFNEKRKVIIHYYDNFFNGFIGFRVLFSPNIYKLSDSIDTVTVHASAVEYNGEGILFCGPKGSGKTSCALSLALVNSFGFITNDYSVLHVNEDSETVKLIGPPEPIRIGNGTFNVLSNYLEGLENSAVINNKRLLLMRDISERLRIVPQVKVKKMYFVTLTEEEKPEISILDKSEAMNFLESQIMNKHGYNTPELWDIQIKETERSLVKTIEKAMKSINTYKVKVPYDYIGKDLLKNLFV